MPKKETEDVNMSKKRFIYGRAFPLNSDESIPVITDTLEEKDYFTFHEIVELLNQLIESKEKQHEKTHKLFWKYQKLKEENETIIKIDEDKYIPTKEMINELIRKCYKLEEENIKIIKENQELRKDNTWQDHEIKKRNAYLVHKGLAEEYIRWEMK